MLSKFRSNRLRGMDSNGRPTRTASRGQTKNRPDVNYEALEKRQLLAWDVSLSSINALNFNGPNDAANNLTLTITPAGYTQHNLPLSGNLVSNLDLDSTLAGEQKLLATSVQSVSVVCNNIANIDGSGWNQAAMNITGSAFNDVLIGSSGDDYIDAKAGNDQVWGLDGNDRIFGDSGNDTIYGGEGNDKLNSALHTDLDDDVIYGEGGDDEITLGYGNDYAYGGAGYDYLTDWIQGDATISNSTYTVDGVTITGHLFEQVYLNCSDAPNHVDGSAWTLSPLYIYGNGGDDFLIGGSQGDWLYGGYGDDSLQGNDGGDSLEGEDGTDNLAGDNGNDTLRGGVGVNFISGGGNNDLIFVTGNDTVDGGSEIDTLVGNGVANQWVLAQANGGLLNGFGFQDVENIQGGSFTDVVKFNTLGTLSGILDMGAGNDRVELNQLSGPMTVDKNVNAWNIVGRVGTVRNNESFVGNGNNQSLVSGDSFTSNWRMGTSSELWVNRISFLNFRALEAGNSTDTLSASGADTAWILTGNNSGMVYSGSSSFSFAGFANLTGGIKDDMLVVYPSATLSGNFNGGAGRNAIDYSNWTSGVSVNLTTQAPGNATAIGGSLLNIAAVLGGSGNDTLIGNSNKASVLVGNDGNDTLTGGALRDMIFGGIGSDVISGGNGDDLLVGGKTNYDNDLIAIRAIQAEWNTNARNFQKRSDNIYGTGTGTRLNGNFFLNASTVTDDTEIDSLTGGNGQDWFFAQLGEITDFVSGGTAPERQN